MAAKNFSQDEIQDLATALDTHSAWLDRQISAKGRPSSVADVYKRELDRFRALRSKVVLTA